MHIAFGSDNNYAQHLGVLMASILVNLKPGIDPCFYIVTDGISDENKKKIEELKNLRNCSITYLSVSLDDFKAYPLTLHHLTIATYFRLKIPYLLPHLDKAIYLDVDTMVDDDLSTMWDIDLSSDEWIGGVQDTLIDRYVIEDIGMPGDAYYFNAGVIIMNLAALRENNLEEKCTEFLKHYHGAIRYVDQDVLNHICYKHVKWIHPKYNYLYGEIYKTHDWASYNIPYTVSMMLEASAKPTIIHYVGAGISKPWHYASRNRFASRYAKYIKYTAWRNHRFADKNFKTFKSKNLFFLRKKVKNFLQKIKQTS